MLRIERHLNELLGKTEDSVCVKAVYKGRVMQTSVRNLLLVGLSEGLDDCF